MGLRLLRLYYFLFTHVAIYIQNNPPQVKFNILNSRIKYLHDIWFLSLALDSKDETLVKAADKNGGKFEKTCFPPALTK